MTKPMPTSRLSLYQCGDVVAVPFPYSDRFAEKRRPALVVSNQKLSAAGMIWLVMITSAKNSGGHFDQRVDDLARAGLTSPSVIRPTKIACLEPSRILRRLGEVAEPEMQSVLANARSFLHFDSEARADRQN
jgi:mRNA interferase MazF